jgi:hypothetical protein
MDYSKNSFFKDKRDNNSWFKDIPKCKSISKVRDLSCLNDVKDFLEEGTLGFAEV